MTSWLVIANYWDFFFISIFVYLLWKCQHRSNRSHFVWKNNILLEKKNIFSGRMVCSQARKKADFLSEINKKDYLLLDRNFCFNEQYIRYQHKSFITWISRQERNGLFTKQSSLMHNDLSSAIVCSTKTAIFFLPNCNSAKWYENILFISIVYVNWHRID